MFKRKYNYSTLQNKRHKPSQYFAITMKTLFVVCQLSPQFTMFWFKFVWAKVKIKTSLFATWKELHHFEAKYNPLLIKSKTKIFSVHKVFKICLNRGALLGGSNRCQWCCMWSMKYRHNVSIKIVIRNITAIRFSNLHQLLYSLINNGRRVHSNASVAQSLFLLPYMVVHSRQVKTIWNLNVF